MLRIIVDTASDITLEEAAANEIIMLPMPIQFGDQSFLDKYELTTNEFYARLVESEELPKTSQITPFSFHQEFQKVQEAGDSAVVILMSSELSNTYHNAVLAASDYENIFIVDSKNVTIGEKCLINVALSMRKEGHDAKSIADELIRLREHICVLALLDTLEYLKKGGRISSTAAFAGNLLSIKPIVAVIDGKVQLAGKARGAKNGNLLFHELINKNGGIDFSLPFTFGYSGRNRLLLDNYLNKYFSSYEKEGKHLPVLHIGCTIGTHIGPDTIAVAFVKRN